MESLEKVPESSESVYSGANFEQAQRVAKAISSSDLVPKEYRNNIPNTLIAMDMANRIGASPMQVMQNLYIVHGKPSWSSTFIIASINSSKKFSPLRFEVSGEGEGLQCYAWAYDLDNKEKVTGPVVTMKMAKAEGWIDKTGSKWKTMPELMIRYRSAAFFGRLYAPDIMMGMNTSEEVIDISHTEEKPAQRTQADKEDERMSLLIQSCNTIKDLENIQDHIESDKHWDEFNERLAAVNPEAQN